MEQTIIIGLTKQPIDMQMAILRSCISDDTLKFFRNLFSAAQKTPDSVIHMLRTHAHGQVNVVMECRNFNLRSQHAGELFEESLIRDHVVVGICDSDIAECLLAEKGLGLTRTIEICRAEEASHQFRSVIASDMPQAQVNAINFKCQKKPNSIINKNNYTSPRSIKADHLIAVSALKITNPLTAAPSRKLCVQHVSSEAIGPNLHFAVSKNNPPSPHHRANLVVSLQR